MEVAGDGAGRSTSAGASNDSGAIPLDVLEAGESEVSELLNILWRRKLLICCVSLLITLSAAALILSRAPRYEAWAAVLLDTRPTKIVDIPGATIRQLLGGPEAAVGIVRSEIDVFRSPRLAETVIQRLNLLAKKEFQKEVDSPDTPRPEGRAPNWIESIQARVRSIQAIVREWKEAIRATTGGPPVTRSPMDVAVDHFMRYLTVGSDPGSYVIQVRYVSSDPVLAASIANELVESYIDLQLSEKLEAVRRANKWLNQRLTELRDKINQSDSAAERFREANALSEVRGVTVSAQQVAEINSQLILAEGARAQKEAELREIQALKAQGGTEAAARAFESPVLEYLREQETNLVRQHGELAAHYGPSHPKMIDLGAQLDNLRKRIGDEVDARIKALSGDVRAAAAYQRSLRQSLAQIQEVESALSAKRVQLRQLEREADANRLMFENLLNRSKQIENEGDIQQPDARIISPARVPVETAFPGKKLLLLVAFVGSVLTSLTVAFGCELLDRAFRSTRQLERMTRYPCIGLTPSFTRSAAPHELSLRRATSRYVDAIRSIRLAIERSDSRRPPKVILVTSAVAQEGKSAFALSLARSAAQAGLRSLLIDCDLRNPSISRLLKKVPYVDFISFCEHPGRVIDEVAQTDTESGMHFIATAGSSRSPQDLLNSPTTREFVSRMRNEYDLVVLDTPPLLAASDALVLSPLADTTIFLVRWGVTPRAIVVHALRMLAREGVRVAGTVLSRVDLHKYRLYGRGEYGYFLATYPSYYDLKPLCIRLS